MAPRVLVIEDSPDVRGYCIMVLQSAGFEVEACGTLAEASRLYERTPDLVVLDFSLPDGDGLQLMREWRAKGPLPPILFLTAREDMKTRLECFQQGAQDYLLKPFSSDELLARAKAHLRVKQSHDDLVKRNTELELVARARQDMADMIVHDLKTPLTSIKGTLQLIMAHGLISETGYEKLIQNAGSAADFMLLMLNDLLDVGQAASANLKTELAPIETAGFFGKLQALFAGRIKSHGITLVFTAGPGTERFTSDHNLLYRVLVNLIANAIKVTPNGGAVEIDSALEDGKLRFTVADRGPGVKDAEKTRIFEKYQTGKRKEGVFESGTGLGLAFCRVATAALSGRVWAEDRPDGGSLFLVELPFLP